MTTMSCAHRSTYNCMHCGRYFCWRCEFDLGTEDREMKTAVRWCGGEECMAAEAKEHNISIDRVRAWHADRGRS